MSKNTPVTAVILAAGKGTRMKSALPKVMHEVARVPMLGHVLKLALDVGAAPISLVVAEGMEEVTDYARALAGDVDVAIQKQQHGTAHAVLAAKPVLGEIEGTLLVLYGDTPLLTRQSIEQLLEVLREDANCAVAVLGFTPNDPDAYGRLVMDDEGRLEKIVEAKDASTQELEIDLCNSGVMAIRGSVAWKLLAQIKNTNAKKEYYLTDIVKIARAAGHTAAVVEADEDEVIGINSRGELAVAEAIFQFRTRHTFMTAGVTLIDPDSVYFAADTIIENDVMIEPNVFFGPGAIVRSGAHIKAFSHIEGAEIGAGTSVGPFARLRPGTKLGVDVKIGNFVELKAADVKAGAKISHLSYIGDALVGEEANIGAGTITCNYDGFLKYKTTIGKNVFVGSNSALVAPVKLGDGAIIAAGSVITEDVAKDALVLARSKQTEKPGAAKTFRDKKSAEKKAKKKA